MLLENGMNLRKMGRLRTAVQIYAVERANRGIRGQDVNESFFFAGLNLIHAGNMPRHA